MGRPPKYNQDRAATIIDAIRGGNTLTNAARMAGIHRDTLNDWRRRFPAFSAAVARAEAEAIAAYVEDLGRASRQGNVAAITFYLERRGGGEWRKPAERVEFDFRRSAERIAAEINQPDRVDEIERDLVLRHEALHGLGG